MLWIKFRYDLEIVDDLWLADDIELPAMELRYLQAGTHTGFAYTDEIFSQWLEFVDRAPLKQISVSTLTDKDKGSAKVKTETSAVLSFDVIEAAEISPGTFDLGTCRQISKSRMKKEATRMLKSVIK